MSIYSRCKFLHRIISSNQLLSTKRSNQCHILKIPEFYLCQNSTKMSKRKAPSEENPNADFVDFLFELSNFEKNVNRNVFKHNAYRKAASVISKLPERLKSGEEARKLDGVGKQIAAKIDEFINTGKLSKIEKIRGDDSSTSINELTRVAGIGPAKARELFDSGIHSVEDLKKNQETLTPYQKIGLKYFEDFELRIPRDEIGEIENKAKKVHSSKSFLRFLFVNNKIQSSFFWLHPFPFSKTHERS